MATIMPIGPCGNRMISIRVSECPYEERDMECVCHSYIDWDWRRIHGIRSGGVWSSIMSAPEIGLLSNSELDDWCDFE